MAWGVVPAAREIRVAPRFLCPVFEDDLMRNFLARPIGMTTIMETFG